MLKYTKSKDSELPQMPFLDRLNAPKFDFM